MKTPGNISILLVDDDIDDQEIFLLTIQDTGTNVACDFACDGIQALQKLGEPAYKPNLIFIDINMPKMNGMELLAELKQNPRLDGTPIYMYSTSDQREIVTRCMELGASGFMKKSPDIEELRRDFINVIDKRTAI
ncbi:response regulator [Dyadobacter fermentans]|uniref:Response regulator receiver protein n=1 Tax=Dyadobacter fermentans (strain ATCC 700827 / DSM 18053 / CIP 107007 / KCTC 52180 / NS114) TaxID=471854 RepID=C6VRK7_DYAFD|nr:response regulator [Dyadobacter fermentans]ACT92710.1 response regulator receiver protein [Dyadobacter fermentans DSM 18053]